MDVDFGVEVVRAFDPDGEVAPAEAPAGEVATALHVGPYDQLRRTHDAIRGSLLKEKVVPGSSGVALNQKEPASFFSKREFR